METSLEAAGGMALNHWSVSLVLARSSGYYFPYQCSLSLCESLPFWSPGYNFSSPKSKPHGSLGGNTLQRNPSLVVWHPVTFLDVLRWKEKMVMVQSLWSWWEKCLFCWKREAKQCVFADVMLTLLHWEEAPQRGTEVWRWSVRERKSEVLGQGTSVKPLPLKI